MALLLAFVVPSLANAAGQGRKAPVQCWTDDRGHRVCGDVVPPAEVRRERALIDRHGVVTGIVPAQKSQAQIEAEAKQARDDEQRQAYDRFLLQTYPDVPAIERARDERLAAVEAQLRLTEKAMADTRVTLADLRGRLARPASAAPAAAEAGLQSRIDQFTVAEADHLKALARLRDEQTRIDGDFARDIARYRALRSSGGN